VEGKSVNRRNWHITLAYIDGFPEEKVPDLLSSVVAIDPGQIRLRFDSLTFWQRPKVACMDSRIVPPASAQLARPIELSREKFELLESVRFRGKLRYHPVKQ